MKRLTILVGIVLSILLNLPAQSHEIPDPVVSLSIDGDLGKIERVLAEQTGWQISSGPSLTGRTASISVVDTPVSEVFGRLRREYQVCAYIPTLNVPGTFIQLTNCAKPHRDCTYGIAEPYPRPKHPINLCGSPTCQKDWLH